MLDFKSLTSGEPVPGVDAGDMNRVWKLLSKAPRPESAPPEAVGWAVHLIADQCSQGADPVAVWARVVLLAPLLEGGLLDNWRDGDRPYDVVFQTLATFPLSEGIQKFRPDEFADALRKAV